MPRASTTNRPSLPLRTCRAAAFFVVCDDVCASARPATARPPTAHATARTAIVLLMGGLLDSGLPRMTPGARRGFPVEAFSHLCRVAVLALLLVVAAPAVAAPTPEVTEHATGAQGMEPMLAVNRRGTLFMGIATDKGLYEDPGRLTGSMHNALLRSRDDGRTWDRIPLPGEIDASEGFPYVDPVTGRLFVTSFSADAARCGQPVVHSDDEGETWTAAATRPGCSPATRGD